MIDTGCQVMILATSVFERMCFSDPRGAIPTASMWPPAGFC